MKKINVYCFLAVFSILIASAIVCAEEQVMNDASVIRQKASQTKYTLETDKGNFYIDKIKNKNWATAVNEFINYLITSPGDKTITIHYDQNDHIVGIKGKNGSIIK